ncbi:MAG: lysine--tRNA ligase [Candidatus ainarchaeum sp.]|nr:lysine--tRNA ligase [Candidatus ainarchaeum sp.]
MNSGEKQEKGVEMQMHWVEQLAEKVKERYSPPYIVSGGMTTSGPTHFGTVCEFLFPGTVQKVLKKQGYDTKFYFIADILDAFDSVPMSMEQYKEVLEPHLGKPLCNVPDPTGKSKSFGDHYLDEAREIMKTMNLDVNLIRINEYYEQGKFDEHALFFIKNEKLAKEIIEETSGRKLSNEFSVLMPICEQCGKIATTRVLSLSENEYEYICDKDVKYTRGCGYKGKSKIENHKYKLLWRIHWPSWHRILKTNLEGAGIDHHTKGGSYDTLKEIYLKMFKEEPPIAYRFGFILFQGRKYSKSKGTGMGIAELSKLIPPQMIAYSLLKPDLTENIDIVPTKENLMRLYDEFEKIGKISEETSEVELEKIDRATQKKIQSYRLCPNGVKWKKSFGDILLAYQVYKDWKKVQEIMEDVEGVEYLKKYIENWVDMDFVPEQYEFRYIGQKTNDNDVRELIKNLKQGMGAIEIHNEIFEYSKKKNIEPEEMFRKMYTALIGKEKGPRLGNLLFALGVERVKKDLL